MKNTGEKFKYARYHIPNVAKAITVIRALSKSPSGMTRAQITDCTGFSDSIIFRILYTMSDYGMVLKNPDKTYSISNEAVIMIDQSPGKNPFGFTGKIGMRCPLHSSAPAKAILAFLPAGEMQAIVDKIKFEKFTPETITNKKKLAEELAAVRKKGYATDCGEYLTGANCVGVPIFDYQKYPVASGWITGPAERVTPGKFDKIGRMLVKKAAEISGKLGYEK